MEFWIWWLLQKTILRAPRLNGNGIANQWEIMGAMSKSTFLIIFCSFQGFNFHVARLSCKDSIKSWNIRGSANGAWGSMSNHSISQNSCGEIGISMPGAMLGLW